jgi:hypothetical protein
VPYDPNAVWTPPPAPGATPPPPAEPTEVPFVAAGGFGGGGGFRRAPVGPLLEPGTYMIKLTVGSKTETSSVVIFEDTWMSER